MYGVICRYVWFMQSSAEAMCVYLPCMSMYIRFVLQLCIIVAMHLACLKYHERLCKISYDNKHTPYSSVLTC